MDACAECHARLEELTVQRLSEGSSLICEVRREQLEQFPLLRMWGTLLEAETCGHTPVPRRFSGLPQRPRFPKITSPKTTNAPTAPASFAFDNTGLDREQTGTAHQRPSMLVESAGRQSDWLNQSRFRSPAGITDMDALREGHLSGSVFVEADQLDRRKTATAPGGALAALGGRLGDLQLPRD